MAEIGIVAMDLVAIAKIDMAVGEEVRAQIPVLAYTCKHVLNFAT